MTRPAPGAACLLEPHADSPLWRSRLRDLAGQLALLYESAGRDAEAEQAFARVRELEEQLAGGPADALAARRDLLIAAWRAVRDGRDADAARLAEEFVDANRPDQAAAQRDLPPLFCAWLPRRSYGCSGSTRRRSSSWRSSRSTNRITPASIPSSPRSRTSQSSTSRWTGRAMPRRGCARRSRSSTAPTLEATRAWPTCSDSSDGCWRERIGWGMRKRCWNARSRCTGRFREPRR